MRRFWVGFEGVIDDVVIVFIWGVYRMGLGIEISNYNVVWLLLFEGDVGCG